MTKSKVKGAPIRGLFFLFYNPRGDCLQNIIEAHPKCSGHNAIKL